MRFPFDLFFTKQGKPSTKNYDMLRSMARPARREIDSDYRADWREKDRIDWQDLANAVEKRGYVTKSQGYWRVGVELPYTINGGQHTTAHMQRLTRCFGGTWVKRKVRRRKSSEPRISHVWVLGKQRDVLYALNEILPYLDRKRASAEKAIAELSDRYEEAGLAV